MNTKLKWYMKLYLGLRIYLYWPLVFKKQKLQREIVTKLILWYLKNNKVNIIKIIASEDGVEYLNNYSTKSANYLMVDIEQKLRYTSKVGLSDLV